MTTTMPIAIVGLAGIFPQARDVQEYWRNIITARDCIEDVPASRWSIDDYYDPDPRVPDKTYSKRGGFLPDVPFDAVEFGMPPNILEVTDVSQMLALIAAREALRDAGYAAMPAALRERTGVVLGVTSTQKLHTPLTARLQEPVWRRALRSSGIEGAQADEIVEKIKLAYIPWEENSFPGMLGNVIAGRVANRLDLGGMNCVVDAACASALGALRMAISELVSGDADMMITGGVDTDNSPFIYLCFSKTPAFSRSGTPRPFAADADGMIVGEGVGMLVLKRLADAERDGDRIYAVIRGVGASSDGRYRSIYAPRAEGQVRALQRAYADAAVDPASVGLIEAHGTGTAAGDLAEFQALSHVFGAACPRRQQIALGSVKSQIGHTKATAGAAGLIKVALALHHKVLPPTINAAAPNPKFHIDETPFYLNTATRPWIHAGDEPRRGAVSAFGFGGTNYHVVVEEHRREHAAAYRMHASPALLLFDAVDALALAAACAAAARRLADEPGAWPALVAAQALRPIDATQARLGMLAGDAATAQRHLERAAQRLRREQAAESWHDGGIWYRQRAMPGSVAALFAGQGSQYPEMGRELAVNFPEVRDWFARFDRRFAADGEPPLSRLVFPPPGTTSDHATALQATDRAQPAIGALSAGQFRVLERAGFRPDCTAGHSFGELTALWAAGALDDAGYERLVYARGRAMAPPATLDDFDPGTMLAVAAGAATLAPLMAQLPEVVLANVNAPDQVVLGGPRAAIAAARDVLAARGLGVTALPVAAAFHTGLVEHARQPFAVAVAGAGLTPPRMPVYANTTGGPYPADPADMQRVLAEQLVRPVQFEAQITAMYAAGCRIFVEFGPRNVLTNLVRRILAGRPHVALALNPQRQADSDQQLREAALQLSVLGVPLGALDQYALPVAGPAATPTGMSILLNGSNVVSDRTREAYERALRTSSFQAQRAPAAGAAAPSTDALARVGELQRAALHAHEQFITGQAEYARLFVELLQQQQALLAQGALSGAGLRVLGETMAQFHAYQGESLRVHHEYLAAQLDQLQQVIGTLGDAGALPAPASDAASFDSWMPETVEWPDEDDAPPPAPVRAAAPPPAPARVAAPPPAPARVAAPPPAPARVAAPPAPALGSAQVQRELFQVVADKTGYPVATLDATMDLEADLGIDSIKRVEILGALQERLPGVPPLSPEAAGELRTLGQIVGYLAPTAPARAAAPTPTGAAPTPVSAAARLFGAAQVQRELFQVIADKTGYPVATLDATMDLEADLGIDSIKRVEILGALQERLPGVPPLSPEAAGELRTLGQIVGHLAPAAVRTTPAAPATPRSSVPAAPGSAQVQRELFQVVADKTGYPVATLDAAMDLEADLGIDSIKRVEILGALQERLPGVPPLSPEAAGELRTLGQIVGHLAGGSAPTAPPAAPRSSTPAAPAAPGSAQVQRELFQVVADKTGYPVATLDAAMDLEADLGIDSIKRVEILGALQERLPGVPPLSPEAAGELRTLGQIIGHLAGGSAPATPPAATPAAPVPAHAAAPIGHEQVQQALFAIVNDKTGYPLDTLEPGLDLEADLGIDSIKRVEILGALQEQMPQLPELTPESAGELRTLGQIVAHLVGATPDAATPAAEPASPALPVAEARLRPLAPPDRLELALPAGTCCLITDDGSPLAAALATRLAAHGWPIVMLRLPGIVDAESARPHVALSDMSEARLVEVLQQIGEAHGPVAAFLHIQPQAHDGAAGMQHQKDVLRHIFLAARQLSPDLNRAGRAAYAAFVTVTRIDGQLGLASHTPHTAIAGGLFGLTKTLRQEWPLVSCRAIDIGPEVDADQAAEWIEAELYDPDRTIVEVGLGAIGRVTIAADIERR
ncbi:MAG: acyltransferase domain-containing protein [Chloroflexi bacterium]|nr:acyltransferase domain-containing protein [Chloroflexota bacterium]